jgi:acyl-CoA thioester hydrolase
MSQVYPYRLTVPHDAVDVNNHVNNVEYLRWMQTAALLHSDKQGCTRATVAAGATWVVRSHYIEYLRPAFAGQDVVVLTWVSNFRRVRSLRKYKIVRLPDREVLVEGETDWVFVDMATGRLRFIPQHIIDCFEILPPHQEKDVLLHLQSLSQEKPA